MLVFLFFLFYWSFSTDDINLGKVAQLLIEEEKIYSSDLHSEEL